MAIQCPKCRLDNPEDTLYCGKCGTKLPPPEEIQLSQTETYVHPKKDLTTGSTFADRYQIIEELGKGGMGKVYKAFDKEIQAKVALKLIKPEIAADKDTIERFRNELKIARDISHKNICRMYDLGRDAGNYYITMEYVPGEDLKNMIRMSGQLGVGTAVNIAKQVCEGLSEAHKLGVVHRDLKPSNIMIDRNGNVRIMDFGIARSIKGKGITGAGVMIGTPEYMSPEQVEGKDIDQRSDIYSLGIILYEMLTGRVPFEGDTPFTVGVKHKSEIPKNPKEFNAHIPEDLGRLILKCLEKTKATRYQSADELRSELDKIEKGIPTAERAIPKIKPLTSKEITVKFNLKKVLIPSVIVIAVVIIGVAIWLLIPHKEAAPAKPGKQSIAVLPFEDLSPAKDHEYLCKGIAETLINSLSNIKDLWVPARASSFSFEGKNLGIREIGRQLAVDNLLEASVQVIGNRLRITPKIIKIKDGSQVWSDQYDRHLEDIFAVQDEIAQEIVKALRIKLLGEQKEELVKHSTHSQEAYDLYLQGRFFWNKRTEEALKKAIEFFEQATEKDSHYALAYTGLADAYSMLNGYKILPANEAYPKAKAAALKALSIENKLSEAHVSLAWILMIYDWDWKTAEKEFKLALELNPNYPTAHAWYGYYFMYTGQFDRAIEEVKRAHELDPYSIVINRALGNAYLSAGRYDEAIDAFQNTLTMDPYFGSAHEYLGLVYLLKARYKEALTEFQKLKDLMKRRDAGVEIWIAIAYAKMGMKNEVDRVMKEVINESDILLSIEMAFLYFVLGEKDRGFKWLEKGYEAREIAGINEYPVFNSVRSDPRFIALLKGMGLQ